MISDKELSERIMLLRSLLQRCGILSPQPDETIEFSLAKAITTNESEHALWLSYVVLMGAYPTLGQLYAAKQFMAWAGAESYFSRLLLEAKSSESVTFEIVHDAILVDVFHTSQTAFATGVQRVVRNTISEWALHHAIIPVSWHFGGRSLRLLSEKEQATAYTGAPPALMDNISNPPRVLIPIGGTYILPEIAAERWRSEKIAALAEVSGVNCGALGHDCVPLTSAETTGEGMPGGFATYLDAIARMKKLSVTSAASETEYRGWGLMHAGTGLHPPTPVRHELAAANYLTTSRSHHRTVGLPTLLIVGSHEPRKNHMAVLFAAERLWREGLGFSLVFVGGNSWASERFEILAQRLVNQGRSIEIRRSISDDELDRLYSQSYFTIYPSLNEGFGLPVAESIAHSIPVITSDFGSMKDIGEGKGAVFINPRSVESLTAAMRTLLTSPDIVEALVEETKLYRERGWEDYAEELWEFFTDHNDETKLLSA